jgi:hypothetical protein
MTIWIVVGFAFFLRIYAVYLIFGYYKRLELGDTLLIELGERKLGKMLEEIKHD